MSAQGEPLTDFERQSRLMLEESVRRIDGRVRSRLNQARQAAVETAANQRRPVFWRSFTLVPTAGAAAAALLVTMVLWHREPQIELPVAEMGHPAEDLDLLADGEGLDLVQEGDGSGSFYEWAAEQSEANGGETDT
jgi:anti-sigma-K factor RskA